MYEIIVDGLVMVTLKSEEVKNLLDGKIKYDEYQENKKLLLYLQSCL